MYTIASGKNKGKKLEALALNNYGVFKYMYKKALEEERRGRPLNLYEKELKTVYEAGEKIKVDFICPQCKQKTVKFFAIRHSIGDYGLVSFGAGFSCCEDDECRKKLLHNGGSTEFYPLKLSYSLKFRYKTDGKNFIRAIISMCGVKRLNENGLIKIFYPETINNHKSDLDV